MSHQGYGYHLYAAAKGSGFGHDTDTIRHDGQEELRGQGAKCFYMDRLLAFAS